PAKWTRARFSIPTARNRSSDAATCCICRQAHRAFIAFTDHWSPNRKLPPSANSGATKPRRFTTRNCSSRRAMKTQAVLKAEWTAARKLTTRCIKTPYAWSAKWAALLHQLCSGACVLATDAPHGSRPREVLKKKDWMREFDESVK